MLQFIATVSKQASKQYRIKYIGTNKTTCFSFLAIEKNSFHGLFCYYVRFRVFTTTNHFFFSCSFVFIALSLACSLSIAPCQLEPSWADSSRFRRWWVCVGVKIFLTFRLPRSRVMQIKRSEKKAKTKHITLLSLRSSIVNDYYSKIWARKQGEINQNTMVN